MQSKHITITLLRGPEKLIRVKARLHIHARAIPWSDTWQNYWVGAREPKFYMQTVQAAKKVKTLMKNK